MKAKISPPFALVLTIVSASTSFFACHNEPKEEPLVSEVFAPPTPIPPSEACILFSKSFDEVKKAFCTTNPSSRDCTVFGEFLQGTLPTFSPTDKFAVGNEITVPLPGAIVDTSGRQDYMVLALSQEKDKPVAFGVTDVPLYTTSDQQAFQSFIDGKYPANSKEFAAAESRTLELIQSRFTLLSIPQSCDTFFYFPMNQVEGHPTEAIVRQYRDKIYLLVLLYSAKHENLTAAYFSVMLSPKRLGAPAVPQAPAEVQPPPVSQQPRPVSETPAPTAEQKESPSSSKESPPAKEQTPKPKAPRKKK